MGEAVEDQERVLPSREPYAASRRTSASSRHPPASAPASLPLLAPHL